MEKRNIIILYDKDDVFEFNNNKNNYSNVFLFAPGLEIFLYKKKKLNIIRSQIQLNQSIHKNVILESQKIYSEYKKNFHHLEKIRQRFN